MKQPWFWSGETVAARAVRAGLWPAGEIYRRAQVLRHRATTPAQVEVPVICIGNATLGGVGKTPFAIALAKALRDDFPNAHFLTRGYGGAEPGPIFVDKSRSAVDVGDEALLLAQAAPTCVSRDRPAGARACVAHGADAVIMDDGFQNPTLRKDVSILLVDQDHRALNGAVFPAGPYREPLADALARADLLVEIRPATSQPLLEADLPCFRAALQPTASLPTDRPIVAFSGIGRPERFFTTLTTAGAEIAHRVAFPDHHRFATAELDAIRTLAEKCAGRIFTTEKDYVRLSPEEREGISFLPVAMAIDDAGQFVEEMRRILLTAEKDRPSA